MKIDSLTTSAIILAAGKGTRMNAGEKNKVTLQLAGKPIIARVVEKVTDAGVADIFVVVGHARESVMEVLGNKVSYITQDQQLGTGHAVKVAMERIPEEFTNTFVFYGDDTSYDPTILESLYARHIASRNALTFLTFEVEDATGLGRIYRNEKGDLLGIVEEKDASNEQKQICEINPGCFIFETRFLRKYLNQIPLNPIKNEYYLTDIIALGLAGGEKIEAMKSVNTSWHGINTPEELEEASEQLDE